jgi:hypothetical protein
MLPTHIKSIEVHPLRVIGIEEAVFNELGAGQTL